LPHQVHVRTLSRKAGPRLSMLRGIAVSVLRYERVKTTEAKAKEVRRLIDRLVRLGQDGSLPARRRALALTRDPLIVEKTFTDLRERFTGRASGFTRLARLGHRVGDGAPMMLVELLEGAPAQPKATEAEPAQPVASGVRGIAQKLRPRRGEPKPEGEKAAKPVKGEKVASDEKAARKAAKPKEKPKAARPKAEQKERAPVSKRAAPKRSPAAEAKRTAGTDAKGAGAKRPPLTEPDDRRKESNASKSKKAKS
jgi:large subunit ribosomal protein L17